MTKKPLSVLTYYIKSKRKILPVLLAIILATVGTVATVALTDSIKKDIWRMLPYYEEYYMIYVYNPADLEGVYDDMDSRLNESKDVDFHMDAHTKWVEYKALVGTPVADVLYLKDSDYDRFLGGLGFSMEEGELPEKGKNEVVMAEGLLTNKEKEVGDRLEIENVSDSSFDIVGSISPDEKSQEDVLVILGNWDDVDENDGDISRAYIIKPGDREDSRERLSELIEDIDTEIEKKYKGVDIEYETEFTMQDELEENFGSMDIIVWAIVLIVTVVMTICIALLNLIFFMQRSSEFGVLAALGYSKGFIIRKALLESLVSIVIGWIMGLVVSFILFEFINSQVFDPKGLSGLNAFDIRNIQFSIPIPISVSLCGAATVLWQLLRLDPVEVIETRG